MQQLVSDDINKSTLDPAVTEKLSTFSSRSVDKPQHRTEVTERARTTKEVENVDGLAAMGSR